MYRLIFTTSVILALAAPSFAAGTHNSGQGHEMEIGMPGDDRHVTRTIQISMRETDDGEMLFEPRTLTFEKGETIKMIIVNKGELEHEFVMGTYEANQAHKALMAEFDMEHDDPNSARLDPGASAEIIWKFSNKGGFQFACLIPGHYESGMHGALDIKPVLGS